MLSDTNWTPHHGQPVPWSTAPLDRLATTRDIPTQVDCVVIGAGFTGLSCARRLALLRPDWSIVVIDALQVGEGASGRNSGFIMEVGHWHDGWEPEVNAAFTRLYRHGATALRELVHARSIDCEWHEGDQFHVAVNDRGARALMTLVEGLASQGIVLAPVPAEELATKIGSTHYRHAFASAGGVLVNPAELVRGMARNLPPNVSLLEREPVERLDPDALHRVRTPQRQLESRHVVVATNGFMGALGAGDDRVMPFATFASATVPLPEPPGSLSQWGVVPEERMGSTVRLTADNRILIRNGVRLVDPPRVDEDLVRQTVKMHRESLGRRYPGLASLPFEFSWGGVLGVSQNGGTVFGSFGDRAWVAGGHNGVGMSQGTALGELLAFRIAGERHPLLEDVARLPHPSWVPPEPLLSLGVRTYTSMLAVMAGAEK